VVTKPSAPYGWADAYTSTGVRKTRSAIYKEYERSAYVPRYDKLLPKGVPNRKPLDLKINYTGQYPIDRRRPTVD
jgi:hypothetical protein